MDDHPLDDALAHIHHCHMEYGPGFSDHAPMVIDALDHIGRRDMIEGWVTRYRTRLDRLGSRREPDETRWVAHFASRLADEPWEQVAADTIAELANATASAAGHGLLRTSHAVRALRRAETPERVAELAHGLAYWRWRSERIPLVESRREATAVEVLRQLKPLQEPDRQGMITGRVRSAITPDFLHTVAAVDLDPRPDRALSEITSAAGACLASGSAAGKFALLHGLTSSVAVRPLLDLAAADDAARLVVGSWTTVAALWAAYGEGAQLNSAPASADVPHRDALVERALAHGDEHAIKGAVAVWSEELLTGDRPELRHAAAETLDWAGA